MRPVGFEVDEEEGDVDADSDEEQRLEEDALEHGGLLADSGERFGDT